MDLQDKQDKSTATTAKIGKNRIAGLVGYRAFIYGLSEAIGPLLKVATLTGFEEATALNCNQPYVENESVRSTQDPSSCCLCILCMASCDLLEGSRD